MVSSVRQGPGLPIHAFSFGRPRSESRYGCSHACGGAFSVTLCFKEFADPIHFVTSAAADWITTGPNRPDGSKPDLSGGLAGLIGLNAILLWV